MTAIRTGKPINTAKETALSTLMAIMGRDSAYTGKGITWTTAGLDQQAGTIAVRARARRPQADRACRGLDHGPPLNPTKS